MPNNENEIILLIQGLKDGNHSCFKKLYDLYSSQLYSFSFKLLKSKIKAEDIVQDTFLKVWDRRARIKTNGSFRSLLMTIALNDIRESFNQNSRNNNLKNELLFQLSSGSEKYSPDNNYEDLLNKLESLLDRLPEKRKLIFLKKKIEGKKAKDIATELKISEKTVEYHVAQTMKFLKAEFKSSGVSGIILYILLSKMQKNATSKLLELSMIVFFFICAL